MTSAGSVLRVRETGQGCVVSLGGGTGPVVRADRTGCKCVTDRLSSRGARAIYDAALVAGQRGRPLSAMWTLTVRESERAPFLDGSRTLSGEVRRFVNVIKKLALCELDGYVWVAECPGDNVHVHMLVDAVIPYSEFRSVAESLEAVWRLGFVHIERLRDHQAGTAYLLKACGYIGKGRGQSQGRVHGRRYGVARCLRVDAVVELDEFSREHALALMVGQGYGLRLVMNGYSQAEAIECLRDFGVFL